MTKQYEKRIQSLEGRVKKHVSSPGEGVLPPEYFLWLASPGNFPPEKQDEYQAIHDRSMSTQIPGAPYVDKAGNTPVEICRMICPSLCL